MLTTLLQMHPIAAGLLASLLAGLATGIGALLVFVAKRIPEKVQDGMLGFAAGVMLAATAFSLVVPGLEAAGGGWKGAGVVSAGILLGGIFLDLLDRYAPHQHIIKGPEGGGDQSRLARIWLFVIAIAIHNFPEGLAVGVATGSGDVASGISVAIGIGLQNIPEGLAVAVALLGQRYSAGRVFFISLLTGLVEPVGGLLGVATVVAARWVLPWGLAFAAGAMLFVIMDEIIPETHERGNERIATFLMLIGFCLMMALDTALAG